MCQIDLEYEIYLSEARNEETNNSVSNAEIIYIYFNPNPTPCAENSTNDGVMVGSIMKLLLITLL